MFTLWRPLLRPLDLILMTKPCYAGRPPVSCINNVKFRKKILLGDTLEIHAELLSERMEGNCHVPVSVFTAGELAAETEATRLRCA